MHEILEARAGLQIRAAFDMEGVQLSEGQTRFWNEILEAMDDGE